jgi:polyhydroxyalkanoate synthesis regulator protein
VTLEDLAGMARNGDDFIVYDARNRADITASVLIQVASVAGPAGGPSRLH